MGAGARSDGLLTRLKLSMGIPVGRCSTLNVAAELARKLGKPGSGQSQRFGGRCPIIEPAG